MVYYYELLQIIRNMRQMQQKPQLQIGFMSLMSSVLSVSVWLLAAVAAAFGCHLPVFAATVARFALKMSEHRHYWQPFKVVMSTK